MADTAPKGTNPVTIQVETAPTDSAPKRRGRPPGSTNKNPANATASADVKNAMSTLDNAYDLIGMGLMLAGLTNTATAWISSAEGLRATNESALKSAPKLARAIANIGSTGGAATLIISHAVAIYGVINVARTELAERRENAETSTNGTED